MASKDFHRENSSTFSFNTDDESKMGIYYWSVTLSCLHSLLFGQSLCDVHQRRNLSHDFDDIIYIDDLFMFERIELFDHEDIFQF